MGAGIRGWPWSCDKCGQSGQAYDGCSLAECEAVPEKRCYAYKEYDGKGCRLPVGHDGKHEPAAIPVCNFCGERKKECNLCVATWPGKKSAVAPKHWEAHDGEAIKTATRIAFYGSGFVPDPTRMRAFLAALYAPSPRCVACNDDGFEHTYEGDVIGGCQVCNPDGLCLNYREFGLRCAKKRGHIGNCSNDKNL